MTSGERVKFTNIVFYFLQCTLSALDYLYSLNYVLRLGNLLIGSILIGETNLQLVWFIAQKIVL